MHELNLLPAPRRLTLRREVAVHSLIYFLSSVSLGAGIATGVGVLILLGLMSYAWRLNAAGVHVEQAVAEYQVLREEIAEKNVLLNYIHGLSTNRFAWGTFLTDLLATTPAGIEIGSVSGSSIVRDNKTNDVLLILNGQAAARGTLTIFADRLRLLPGVTQVDAPNSNLIKRENPLYRFTIHLDPAAHHEKNIPAQPTL